MIGAIRNTALASVVAAASAGCGEAPPARPVPVSGTVISGGKLLESGRVVFVPDDGRPAEGVVKDGRFTLTTAAEGDGAVPGRHRVGVVATKEAPEADGGGPPLRSIVAEVYADPFTSRVEAEVPPKGTGSLEIRLK